MSVRAYDNKQTTGSYFSHFKPKDYQTDNEFKMKSPVHVQSTTQRKCNDSLRKQPTFGDATTGFPAK